MSHTPQLKLPDGDHVLRFSHNTVTGQRSATLDEKIVFKTVRDTAAEAVVWTAHINNGHAVCVFHWTNAVYVALQGWMFKLVGSSLFEFECGGRKHNCTVEITPAKLKYLYRLYVDGKTFEQFSEKMRVLNKTWLVSIDDTEHSVVLGRTYSQEGCICN